MAQITAALVKELRENTGAGMMDCKKALAANDGNIDESIDWLRTKGLAAAAKKAGRVAAEGLVAVAVSGNKGAIVEVNSETDFVARNETFQQFANNVATIALEVGDDLDVIKAAAYPETDRSVAEELTHMISTIGENMSLRRVSTTEVSHGVVASYIHNALTPTLGKIAVLVALESEADAAVLDGLGKQVSMHIAAVKPQSISQDDLDKDVVASEKAVLFAQAKESGKPDDIIEKMLVGRMRKYFQQVCLLEQTYVIDGESKVGDAIAAAGKEAGSDISLKDFKLFVLGDGIEKKEEDFAAEVAAAVGG